MNFTWPESNLSWLRERTLFLTVHGSHAYGTNRAGSDLDVRGICVPPAIYFHGYSQRFEQAEFRGDNDLVVYDLRKFFKLAADCNPNVLELLYTDEKHHLLVSEGGQTLLEHRDMFLSKRAQHTFSGYAISQLKRIKLHRRWLLNPPSREPTRAQFGLPERTLIPADQLGAVWSQIRSQIEAWDVNLEPLTDASRIDIKARIADSLAEQGVCADSQWRAAARKLGATDNFIELMDGEKRHQAAVTEWRSYQNWLTNRNPGRAEMEKKFGFDTKHATHLVRLMRMAIEVLDGRGLLVFRPDRDELLAIRDGAWNFDSLMVWAEATERLIAVAAKNSGLPRGPDVAHLDDLCRSMVESALR
jgi:hypothetical protein